MKKGLLAAVVSACLILGAIPFGITAFAAGESEANPLVVYSFAELKAAMESTSASTRYIKLKATDENLSGIGEQYAAIYQAVGSKTLILDGNSTFTAVSGSYLQTLVEVYEERTLDIKGSGKLEFRAHYATSAYNSVIHVMRGVLNVHEGVTLCGGINTLVYGLAVTVFGSGGTLNLYGGTLLGKKGSSSGPYSSVPVVTVAKGGKVNIESGTVGHDVPASEYGYGKAISLAGGTNPSDVSITIKSGFFRYTEIADLSAWLAPGSTAIKTTEGGYSGVKVTAPISNVAFDVSAPVAGSMPPAMTVTTSTPNVTIGDVVWKNMTDDVLMTDSMAFETGKTYRCTIVALAASGYSMTTTSTATVNGSAPTAYVLRTASGIMLYNDFEISIVPISNVTLNVTVPIPGATPANVTTATANTRLTITKWYHNGNPFTGTFAAGETYRCQVTVTPTSGNSFTATPTATINGKGPTGYAVRSSSTITCFYTFTLIPAISEVAISVAVPAAGASISSTGTATATTAGTSVTQTSWAVVTGDGQEVAHNGVFAPGKTYRCTITVRSAVGYVFSANAAVTINDSPATVASNTEESIICTYDFVLPASYPRGDVTLEGIVDIDDILAVRGHMFGTRALTGEGLAQALELCVGEPKTIDIDVILAIRAIMFGTV